MLRLMNKKDSGLFGGPESETETLGTIYHTTILSLLKIRFTNQCQSKHDLLKKILNEFQNKNTREIMPTPSLHITLNLFSLNKFMTKISMYITKY